MSYRFTLCCEDIALRRRATELIRAFADPIDGDEVAPAEAAATYSLRSEDGGGPLYGLYRGSRRLLGSHDPGVVVSQLLWQVSSDTVDSATGYLLIHAGAVVSAEGRGVLLLGESGSGKTTLVAALVQEGFGFLSDEAGAIELETGLAHPWTRPLGFKRGARALARFAPLFPETEAAEEVHVPIDHVRAGAVAGPAAVGHVIDYRHREGAATGLESLSRAEALARMGSAAPRLRREGSRGLQVLASVMRGAKGHRLVSGELDQAIRAVRELVAQ